MKRFVIIAALIALSGCTMMRPPAANMPSKNGIVAGEEITVRGNENVYAIAHAHNVSMRELIVLNDLKPPFDIRPGQTLILPATGSSFGGDMKPPTSAPLDAVEKVQLNPIEPAAVSSQPLEPAGNAPQSLTPQPVQPQPVQGKLGIQSQSLSEPVRDLNRPTPASKQVSTTMAPEAAAAPVTAPVAAAAPAAVAAEAVAMVWPVQGPILSPFGSKGVGLNNDGINIGAPKGAPVVASASGTVVYAGNEMKGFGNLVLIRHQGDWVTAYAHLDRVLVKKDSVVGQGDMIGTVGKTGNVTSPQLHFETRQSGKPVDPAGVIKSNT